MEEKDLKLLNVNNIKSYLIDFLPIIYRSLRRDGFMLDHIIYYTNCLRPMIEKRNRFGKFLIRRDPRDLSRIYVYLEEEKSYIEVPYRKLSHPSISLFEHRIALARIKEKGKEQVNENNLFRAISEMRQIIKASESRTRSSRRKRARIEENAKIQRTVKPIMQEHCVDVKNSEAFEDIEVW